MLKKLSVCGLPVVLVVITVLVVMVVLLSLIIPLVLVVLISAVLVTVHCTIAVMIVLALIIGIKVVELLFWLVVLVVMLALIELVVRVLLIVVVVLVAIYTIYRCLWLSGNTGSIFCLVSNESKSIIGSNGSPYINDSNSLSTRYITDVFSSQITPGQTRRNKELELTIITLASKQHLLSSQTVTNLGFIKVQK